MGILVPPGGANTRNTAPLGLPPEDRAVCDVPTHSQDQPPTVLQDRGRKTPPRAHGSTLRRADPSTPSFLVVF